MKIKSNTVLISMEHKGKLYFAADRRMSWDMSKAEVSPTKKVAKRNGILLAGTGHAALCFELVHRTNLPNYTGGNPEDFVHTQILPTMFEDLRYKGFMDQSERRLAMRTGNKHPASASILVGLNHHSAEPMVFEIDFSADDITVLRIPNDSATGCGGYYAQAILKFLKETNFKHFTKLKEKRLNRLTGKMETMSIAKTNAEVLGLDAEDILTEAVYSAAKHSPGCDDNIDIEVL
jgi:hypothetical protein